MLPEILVIKKIQTFPTHDVFTIIKNTVLHKQTPHQWITFLVKVTKLYFEEIIGLFPPKHEFFWKIWLHQFCTIKTFYLLHNFRKILRAFFFLENWKLIYWHTDVMSNQPIELLWVSKKKWVLSLTWSK